MSGGNFGSPMRSSGGSGDGCEKRVGRIVTGCCGGAALWPQSTQWAQAESLEIHLAGESTCPAE